MQKDCSTPSSYTDSEKTEQISSLHVDSSAWNDKTSTALSLSDANCENGHSSSSAHPVSVLHQDNFERMRESCRKNLEKLHKTAQETFDDKKLAENDHMKVTVSSCISIACLKKSSTDNLQISSESIRLSVPS